MKTYHFFCNFCGNPFEAARCDAKTCTDNCRTRLARMITFNDEESSVYCTICGKQHKRGENNEPWCNEKCYEIVKELKVRGMTEEVQKKIDKVLKSVNKEKEADDIEDILLFPKVGKKEKH